MKSIYVGNLPYGSGDQEIRELFEQHGAVHSVKLISDRETGRPSGFGFVEMEDDDAERAIEALDGSEMGGRRLKINLARERKPKRRFESW